MKRPFVDYETPRRRESGWQGQNVAGRASLVVAGLLCVVGLVSYGIADRRGKQAELLDHAAVVVTLGAVGLVLGLLGLKPGRRGRAAAVAGALLNLILATAFFFALGWLA